VHFNKHPEADGYLLWGSGLTSPSSFHVEDTHYVHVVAWLKGVESIGIVAVLIDLTAMPAQSCSCCSLDLAN